MPVKQYVDLKRNSNRRPRRTYQPDDVFGLLTLHRQDRKPGLLSDSAQGWWIARCQCGKLVRVHTRDLRRGSKKGYSCLDCPPPPTYYQRTATNAAKHGKPLKPFGPPPLALTGISIGRLTPIAWHSHLGWECRCATCGGIELAPTPSVNVFLRGIVACDGMCVADDEPTEESETEWLLDVREGA